MACGCILGWQSVMEQFCDLDLISTIIMSGAYLIYYLREESQICCVDTSLDADVSHTIFEVTVILTYDLVSRIIMSGAYPILFDVGITNLGC